jgi:hypothetical protein
MVIRAKKDAADRAAQQAAMAEVATAVAAEMTSAVLRTSIEAAALHAVRAAEQARRAEEEAEAQRAASQLVVAAIQSVLRALRQSSQQHPNKPLQHQGMQHYCIQAEYGKNLMNVCCSGLSSYEWCSPHGNGLRSSSSHMRCL